MTSKLRLAWEFKFKINVKNNNEEKAHQELLIDYFEKQPLPDLSGHKITVLITWEFPSGEIEANDPYHEAIKKRSTQYEVISWQSDTMGIFQEYMLQSSLHGAKYVVDSDKYSRYERVFWAICIIISWVGSVFLIKASLDAFNNNAISFVVESSYRDWDTDFPSVFICENKNMDRVQEAADKIFGEDHGIVWKRSKLEIAVDKSNDASLFLDFTLEEMLSEIVYFRGESYHTIHECAGDEDIRNEKCLLGNYSYYANFVRSTCQSSLSECSFNGKPFDCCKHFIPIETEVGRCFALNSGQTKTPPNYTPLNLKSNRFTGPGSLKIRVLTESFMYTIGYYEVPNLVTPKTDILQIDQFIHYQWVLKTEVGNKIKCNYGEIQIIC